MRPGLVRILMAGLLGLALLGLVLDRSRMVDTEEHYRYLTLLSQVQELEISLNEIILRARHTYINNYDQLVEIMNRLRHSVEGMQQVPSFVLADAQQQLEPLMERYLHLHNKRETLVENFKSDNAILHNSLSFFPFATGDLVSQVVSSQPQLANRLQHLMRDMLMYNLYSNAEMRQQLEDEVKTLSRISPFSVQIDQVAWQRTIRHAEVILAYKKELDQTTIANLNLPTRDVLHQIQNSYQTAYLTARKDAGNYRLLLYLLTILLGAGMAYSMIHRYNVGLALQQINAELEKKVGERTAELEQNNLLLQEQKAELDQSFEQLQRAQEELKHMAMTDELTGLYVRRFVFEWLKKELAGLLRYQGQLGCLMLDIDHFKQINDERGHMEGDKVLRRVALTISDNVRSADIVGRFGGEEFIAFLPGASLNSARQVGEKVRQAVAGLATDVPVTISVGVAQCHGEGLAANTDVAVLAERLIAAADAALYQAKHQGRNQVVATAEPF